MVMDRRSERNDKSLSVHLGKVLLPWCLMLLYACVLFWKALDVTPDPEVRRLLDWPIVQDLQYKIVKASNDSPMNSPLVAQAQAFALLLNPPKAPEPPKARPVEIPQEVLRPVVTSPKFTVVATSVYAAQPDQSRALVSEPGSGLRWVRPGDSLGHLVVHDIRAGLVVYRDGTRTGEVAIDIQACPVDLAVPAPSRPNPKIQKADTQALPPVPKAFTRVTANKELSMSMESSR